MPWKRQGCKGCHKDIQDGYTENKDTNGRATDEIQKSYGYQLQIRSAKSLRKNQAVEFFRSHKDITDVTDGHTGGKDDE